MIDWTTTDDGMLGGHAGVMPVYRRDDGEYYSLIEGLPLTLALNLD